uniref:Alpha-mannosidase n=1 Tax=Percolomonas cosmopolitus TaxID=63605 RepID=A0A7S1KQR5_9EUKA|mmetsp:Transcript_4874/g.18285  ORF Transcript_4874/g.18285 Transcript_4874/m.18285 type:complete len:1206 (+) Transcript_4874:292-3909(+)
MLNRIHQKSLLLFLILHLGIFFIAFSVRGITANHALNLQQSHLENARNLSPLRHGRRDTSHIREPTDGTANATPQSPLTIHLIPHSHCDPGWLLTVDQYYSTKVSQILTSTLEQLLIDESRRFQWNEIIYFKMWYESLDDEHQSQFRRILSKGQWEFVGAGITQNDEATTTHWQIIEQMTQGHLYLKETFKELLPPIRATWQIDPFGHSKIFARLVRMMRLEWHVIDRVDERLKYEFKKINGSGTFEREKSFEFNWQVTNDDTDVSQTIFTHVLDHMYVAPEYCYRNVTDNSTVCTGFDFEDGGDYNPPLTPENTALRASQFIDYVNTEVAPFYRTSQILIPMGHDFSYQNAEVWFQNMDRLMTEINNDKTGTYGGANVRYSTVSEYFDAVMHEKNLSNEKRNKKRWHSGKQSAQESNQPHGAPFTTEVSAIEFPTRAASQPDFFPFTNCWAIELNLFNNCVAYWSGYFSSHPEFKRQTRLYSALMRAADLLHVYALSRKALMPVNVDWEGIYSHLNDLRDAVALTTHHDAITGTSKQEVMDDYMKRLDIAAKPVEVHMQHLLSLLIATEVTQIPTLNVAYRTRLEYNADVSVDGIMPIVVFNDLAWQRVDYISVTVPSEYHFNVSTIDENTKRVILVSAERVGNEILFLAQAPPVGFNTYFLTALESVNHVVEKFHETPHFSEHQAIGVPLPPTAPKMEGSSLSQYTGLTPIITLCNDFMEANFHLHDEKSLPYVLRTIHLLDAEKTYRISQTLLSYESYEDGAYIFRPEADAIHIDSQQVQLTSLKLHGNVKEIEQQLTPEIKQKFRVYNGVKKNTADMSYFVEMVIESTCGPTQEIVSRFQTDIDSKDTFFTDSNAFQLVERRRQPRFDDLWHPNVLSGNFYPMTTQAVIRDEDTQLTIFSNQAVGASSQAHGHLEVMLNRRTITDDHRGLNTPLNVTTPSISTFRISIMSVDAADSLRSQQSLFFEHPMVTFYHANLVDVVPRPSFHIQDYFKLFSTYGVQMNPLPENVHLLTMRNTHAENGTAILRLHHIFEPHQDLVHSKPVTLFLQQVFDKYKFTDLYETSLTTIHDLSGNLLESQRMKRGDLGENGISTHPLTSNAEHRYSDPGDTDEDPTKITLDPLQIRTFRITLSAKDGPQTWNWLSFLIGGSVAAMILILGATCVLCVYRYSILQERRTLNGVKSVNMIDSQMDYEEILDESD